MGLGEEKKIKLFQKETALSFGYVFKLTFNWSIYWASTSTSAAINALICIDYICTVAFRDSFNLSLIHISEPTRPY